MNYNGTSIVKNAVSHAQITANPAGDIPPQDSGSKTARKRAKKE